MINQYAAEAFPLAWPAAVESYRGEFGLEDLRALAKYAQAPRSAGMRSQDREALQAAAGRVLAELGRGQK